MFVCMLPIESHISQLISLKFCNLDNVQSEQLMVKTEFEKISLFLTEGQTKDFSIGSSYIVNLSVQLACIGDLHIS